LDEEELYAHLVIHKEKDHEARASELKTTVKNSKSDDKKKDQDKKQFNKFRGPKPAYCFDVFRTSMCIECYAAIHGLCGNTLNRYAAEQEKVDPSADHSEILPPGVSKSKHYQAAYTYMSWLYKNHSEKHPATDCWVLCYGTKKEVAAAVIKAVRRDYGLIISESMVARVHRKHFLEYRIAKTNEFLKYSKAAKHV
jgi:hypothetical protein